MYCISLKPNIAVITIKFKVYTTEKSSKDADEIGNSADPDQTALLGAA